MMQIHSYQFTPIGFRSPLYTEAKHEPEADRLITESWAARLTEAAQGTGTWAFRRKVINRALDLFRHFPEWLAAQEDNPRLTPHMRAFLEDTLQFINTGRRHMAVTTRAQCLSYEVDLFPRPKYASSRHSPKLKAMLNVDGKDYMYHWLKHDNGFDDMLATVNVIFGDFTAVVGSSR